jgi:hypothetical protein
MRNSEKPRLDVRAAIRLHGEKILGPERLERYRNARRILARKAPQATPPQTILRVTETGITPRKTFVLGRGNPSAAGEEVQPGFLDVIDTRRPTIPAPSASAATTGRRSVLADWIVDPKNPLTARVMANRVFQYHFGRGIVRSSSNFGVQGDKPTHPELLDWLASELIESGWRLKPLHKTIMLSRAYQASSRSRSDALAADPLNDLLWRFDMRRLTAEEIRDTVLLLAGRLVPRMRGPGVFPEIPAEVMAGQSVPGLGWGKSPRDQADRRSIYIHVKRSLLVPILEGYDLAETDRSTPVRFNSTQPTQALGMINGSFMNGAAASFAERLRRDVGGDDPSAIVRRSLLLATGRAPGEAEVARGVALITSLEQRDGYTRERAITAFALVVFNLNEMIFLD